MSNPLCKGEHEIFVVECVGLEAEGKVVVLSICRLCGELFCHEKQVAKPSTPLRLLREEKGNNKS